MNTINADSFKLMLASGVANLANHQAEIDKLNVFPVPDGDTGTNMTMTVENGYKQALTVNDKDVSKIALAFSKGLLMGARGNSGVITSQIFRGFASTIEGMIEISAKDIAEGFENGARIAYKAIMKPVEGTILTVIREASWYAKHEIENRDDVSIEEYFNLLYKFSQESLDNTPNLLPILKEVGVVDSGGAGLVSIIEGFKAFADGNPYQYESKKESITSSAALNIENDEFGYCTEFILRLDEKYKDFDENILKNKLTSIGGESLVVVKDDDLVKVHVHMMKPGEALNVGQRYGEFIKLKIENMQEQHSTIISNENKEKEIEAKHYGIIAVGSGKGIEELLKKCNCDIVVSGGQTMNPSTEDFVNEVKKLGKCKHVLIFPNNSNIILAAKQVAQVFTDRHVHVVETKSIAACVSCLSNFDPEGHLLDNLDEFERVLNNFEDASITHAIKDTIFDGVEVKEGDYIAIKNKTIVSSSFNRVNTIDSLLDRIMENKFAELLTVFIGEEGTTEEANHIKEYVESKSDIEVQVFNGGQPIYCYLFGIE